MSENSRPCELCISPGGVLLWETGDCRVVRVDDLHYPGFCRVIWTSHVREMTDLSSVQQQFLMSVVFGVEATIRALFRPDKINLASFGNMVPHVHWHVIPRWADDRHFPEPIWGAVHNAVAPPRPVVSDQQLRAALADALQILKSRCE